MKKLRDNHRAFIAASCTALVMCLGFCDRALGQSGRRAPRTFPPSSATPPPVSAEEEAVEQVRKFSELRYPVQMLIARQSTSKRLPSETIVFNSFIQRLNELPNIEGKLIGELKRDQAAKRALSETDAYVVLLQFEIDNFQGGRVIINSPDLEVKYFVFAPLDKQPQLKGKIYYQSMGGPQGRKANSPDDPPIRITAEAAGYEAAERLYFWLAELVGTKRD